MRTAVAAIVLISAFASAAAESAGPAEVVAQIEGRLVRSPVLRASFEQQRTMQVLKRPISTRGRVTAVTGRGVLWQVRAPHQATVLMTAEAIVEWDHRDIPRPMEMAAAPVFRALAGPLLGALTGDLAGLATRFEPTPLPTDRGWRLLLAPKGSDLASMISEIEIAGDRFIEEVVIREAGGDRTAIAFDDFRTEPRTLDASEQAYFAY